MKMRGMAGLGAAVAVLLAVMFFTGCGGGTSTVSRQASAQEQVTNESLLQQAGFKRWRVNQTTMPQQEALLSALPKGTLVTYERDGKKLHAYGDKDRRVLYIGDEAAYQRYLSLAQGKAVYAQKEGAREGTLESVKFWGSMEEYRVKGGGEPEK
jgi:hypothetical protein